VEPADGEEDTAADKGQFLSQIWNSKGKLVYVSDSDIDLPPQKEGLNTVRWAGEEWHTFTLRDGGLTIQVANTTSSRQGMFTDIAPWLLLPLSVLVAVLGFLIWTAVGRALAPLRQIRDEIGTRDITSLHALETRNLPDEIQPVVEALNALLARLDAALLTQRRFVADAAHELRTPLTAVRLQAQLAQKTDHPDERAATLDQLMAGVDRATHLIEQLLRMARLDPDMQHKAFSPVRLDEVVKRVVGDFSSQAEAKGIDLGVEECTPVTVSGQAEGLRILVGNLVDNALRYTPAGGRVDVSLQLSESTARLTVSDTGPGIPPAERERVFDRFYRISGAEIPGSGLGLAIVRQVVELHGGNVDLADAPGGGLMVIVSLPAGTGVE
jgi:signal transduction histidine kinase